MTFKITNQKWSSIIKEDEIGQTMTELLIWVGDVNLTENYNSWSKTVDETALVSSAPLAMWFLQSWWRLLYEPYQSYRGGSGKLNTDWRMSHELGAANHGFVWPKIAFVSDLQNIHIVAKSTEDRMQSVRYINSTDTLKKVSLSSFANSIDTFISETVERLNSLGRKQNTILELWEIVRNERFDPKKEAYRKIEAMMGFDPDEASEIIMRFALDRYDEIGRSSLEELAVSYGKFSKKSLLSVEEFLNQSGIFGKPILPKKKNRSTNDMFPWREAVEDASAIRKDIGNEKDPIETPKLFEILGVSSTDQKRWEDVTAKQNASVGIPGKENGSVKFIPRKKHPLGKRFELARYLGGYLTTPERQWIVSTDLSTARQKYQRAFAAEFLCPLGGLLNYIEDDFSKDTLEDAAEHFQVSSLTVESILANNGYLKYPYDAETYYSF